MNNNTHVNFCMQKSDLLHICPNHTIIEIPASLYYRDILIIQAAPWGSLSEVRTGMHQHYRPARLELAETAV